MTRRRDQSHASSYYALMVTLINTFSLAANGQFARRKPSRRGTRPTRFRPGSQRRTAPNHPRKKLHSRSHSPKTSATHALQRTDPGPNTRPGVVQQLCNFIQLCNYNEMANSRNAKRNTQDMVLMKDW